MNNTAVLTANIGEKSHADGMIIKFKKTPQNCPIS
jgi:hypothetical protein